MKVAALFSLASFAWPLRRTSGEPSSPHPNGLANGVPPAEGSGIPPTFTARQAETVLALARLDEGSDQAAARLVQSLSHSHFSPEHATCIQELLQLDWHDLVATLLDAMEPCDLRDRLRAFVPFDACILRSEPAAR